MRRAMSWWLVWVVAVVGGMFLPSTAAADRASGVSVGAAHTCAVTTGGGVKCWGSNYNGQLGNASTYNQPRPVDVVGLTSGAVAVAAGGSHTCALTTGGGVKCWGANAYGQLGNGTTTQSTVPVDVLGLASGVVAVTAAGGAHTCALTTGGGVKCWGANTYGFLGNGTTADSSIPVDVTALTSGVAAIAGGQSHTCALTTGGGVKCWGMNPNGELGNPPTWYTTVPLDVIGLTSGAVAITAGNGHTCAVTTGGGVKCWGANTYGQLGNGTTTQSTVPVDVIGLTSGVMALSASSGNYTCALTAGGGVECWGNNFNGQLGDGTAYNYRTAPVSAIGLGSGVAVVSADDSHTCAVTNARAIKCWGNNAYGQLGNGTTTWDAQLGPVRAVGFGIADAFDLTGDAKADVVWRHATRGEVWVWRMDGTTILAESYVAAVDVGYQIVGIADFDGDGKADILWRHPTNGQVWIWLMNGATIRSATWVDTIDVGYEIVGTGDFDGDGKADILWRHKTNGQVWIWLMDGTTVRSETWVGTVDVGYEIVGVGSFDGDWRADILWRHKTNGQVWIWLMNGVTRRSQTWVGTVDVGYEIVGTGDYDGDGKADILWHHGTLGHVWVWLMDGVMRRSQTWVATVDVAYQIVNPR